MRGPESGEEFDSRFGVRTSQRNDGRGLRQERALLGRTVGRLGGLRADGWEDSRDLCSLSEQRWARAARSFRPPTRSGTATEGSGRQVVQAQSFGRPHCNDGEKAMDGRKKEGEAMEAWRRRRVGGFSMSMRWMRMRTAGVEVSQTVVQKRPRHGQARQAGRSRLQRLQRAETPRIAQCRGRRWPIWESSPLGHGPCRSVNWSGKAKGGCGVAAVVEE